MEANDRCKQVYAERAKKVNEEEEKPERRLKEFAWRRRGSGISYRQFPHQDLLPTLPLPPWPEPGMRVED